MINISAAPNACQESLEMLNKCAAMHNKTKHLPLRPARLLSGSRRCDKASCDLNPLGYAAALLALYIDNIGVASASAAHSVLFLCVPLRPILVLFSPAAPFFLQRWCAEGRILARIVPWAVVGCPWHLSRWSVRRTVLDCCMSVSDVAEVVDLVGG